MASKLSDQLQKCRSIDDVVDAFIDTGFKRAHEIDSKRKTLSITPTGRDFLNIVIVDKLPSGLQPPEKRAGVRAALYISDNFKQYKFFLTRLISGKEPSYSFTTSVLKSTTQLGNLARVKINNLRFDEFSSIQDVVETSAEQAIKNFEENLSVVVKSLRKEIEGKIESDQSLNKDVVETAIVFSSFIGPEFNHKALIEILIQHLLTKDIFAAAYGKTFQRGNIVADSLEVLARRFSDIPTLINNRHDLKERRDSIIQVIELNPIKKRLEIIKLVYETFYSVYNPLDADRLGIVYTPKIAVDFIIRSTDKLMSKHLQANFSDKNIHIIDPCIGTGTFMISLLNYMKQDKHVNNKLLISKYRDELHANEVSILAYYIAAMNVERALTSITGKTISFPGIVWRDTLLALSLDDFPKQGNANVARMNAQQKRKITIIMGNPPYNAGQKNLGDRNPNPSYPGVGGVDERITKTYHARSKFRKQTRDMYKRFIRWSSDKIGERGIVSFISNSSFVHANNYDGMRACLVDEYDYIYICDLRGNAYLAGDEWAREGDKFFGNKSRVGVAIYFLIKTGQPKTKPGIVYYANVGDRKTLQQKYNWIDNKAVEDLKFSEIIPDVNNTWIGPKADPNYKKFLPLISYESKKGKQDNALFQLFTNGPCTGADEWQTDFNSKVLGEKIKVYIKEYNRIRLKYIREHSTHNFDIAHYTKDASIRWQPGLNTKARANKIARFDPKRIFPIIYRPFVLKYFYYDDIIPQVLYRWPKIIKLDSNIPVMCVRARSAHKFECLAARGFCDRVAILHSQNVPLYRLDSNNKLVPNITEMGLSVFREHYNNSKIKDLDIFYYCYAALSDLNYVKKYGYETKTLFPHVPLHPGFYSWSELGKALYDLHVDFKNQPKYQLCEVNEGGNPSKFILNLTKSTHGVWKARIDESLSLDGIPAIAADPKINGFVSRARTPIGWMLEYYQKACRPSRSKVPKNLSTLNFILHRNEIIDLVYKLCTVSVETVKLQNKISELTHSFIPCKESCCKKIFLKNISASKKISSRKRTTRNKGQKKL